MARRADPLAEPRELLDRLYAYVAYLVGDGPDAEDITSEAFTRALRYRDSFDPAKGTPISWLIGIARRVIAGEHGSAEHLPLEGDEWHGVEPDVAEGRDRALVVRAAVARLAPRDRELIALRFGADLTSKQISALLDLQVNAVEVALHRAVGRLRSELEPGLREPGPDAPEQPARSPAAGR